MLPLYIWDILLILRYDPLLPSSLEAGRKPLVSEGALLHVPDWDTPWYLFYVAWNSRSVLCWNMNPPLVRDVDCTENILHIEGHFNVEIWPHHKRSLRVIFSKGKNFTLGRVVNERSESIFNVENWLKICWKLTPGITISSYTDILHRARYTWGSGLQHFRSADVGRCSSYPM